jgi:hypothetical protein
MVPESHRRTYGIFVKEVSLILKIGIAFIGWIIYCDRQLLLPFAFLCLSPWGIATGLSEGSPVYQRHRVSKTAS